ncbi:hypothetical protein Tbd_2322 [Thiobacillus denitrificans ATCC 25259]|uniref:Uncharacterized protein n=1 Tax=Thiobacillus denitrificans (strain ATCC 25259 / T1) TaxID=292415 RepID=Q3SGH5_THIDA|nr:hypothetical protein [Thiobacillus denitrificans]AAZ98275.1 hypothetical protein Tbd_2322 [Thiobacillus denitrificans ATCC 25259]
MQFRRVLKTLKPVEIPQRYCTSGGVATSLAVVVLGIALPGYLFSEL